MNVKTLFNYLGGVTWIFACFFIMLAAMVSKVPALAVPAKALSSIILTPKAAMYYSTVLLPILVIFYIDYRLTWDNGLLISSKKANVSVFDVRKFLGMTVICLRTETKLWLLAPVTSEGRNKIPNRAMVERQMEDNALFVKKLQHNLLQSGAVKGKFRLFNTFTILGLCAVALSFIWVLIQLTMTK